jgi:ribonuclease HII
VAKQTAEERQAAEQERLHQLTRFERRGWRQGFRRITGVDEAGRGPLAGPVIAAACCVPRNWSLVGLNDSKQLTAEQREALYSLIIADPKLSWGVGRVDADRIDAINIHQATHEAMLQAVAQIDPAPDLLLVDGKIPPRSEITTWPIVDGDALVLAIAAASVIAKVTRDRIMMEYHARWPYYGFDQHKGYATAVHREALAEYGPCPVHRRSFGSAKLAPTVIDSEFSEALKSESLQPG